MDSHLQVLVEADLDQVQAASQEDPDFLVVMACHHMAHQVDPEALEAPIGEASHLAQDILINFHHNNTWDHLDNTRKKSYRRRTINRWRKIPTSKPLMLLYSLLHP